MEPSLKVWVSAVSVLPELSAAASELPELPELLEPPQAAMLRTMAEAMTKASNFFVFI